MTLFLNWFKRKTDSRESRNYHDDTFRVGQIWNYNTRRGEENSVLTILKVEKYDTVGIVIHISIDTLISKNTNDAIHYHPSIGHLPLSKEALLHSVTTLISEDNPLPDFNEGYTMWREAFDNNKGGIFSITVCEIANYIEDTINEGKSSGESA